MNNKIEMGCRAVIVNTQSHNGIRVVVGPYLCDGKKVGSLVFAHGKRWLVDLTVLTRNTQTGKISAINHISEYELRRINDDGDARKQVSWADVENVWRPKGVTGATEHEPI